MATSSDKRLETPVIAEFSVRLRRGEITAEAVTSKYLERIGGLDGKLGAFTHIAAEQALRTARALDRLLTAGTDLGPLMGVPIALKDLFSVDGMPTTAGSDLDVSAVVEPEGSFVRLLKRSGCVILGKTRTSEFAFGGVNFIHRIPWNPCDAAVARMPGGSSHGSAVARAADLCAFSVGSDAAGSVRLPAALCGVFGYKASPALWPTDGVFPLSTTMDSIGMFTASARDAAIIFTMLTGQPVPEPRPLRSLRFGKPCQHFFEGLDTQVESCILQALEALEKGGVELLPVEIPEVAEIDAVFAPMVPAEFIATIGRDRFLSGEGEIDSVAWARASVGLDLAAVDYLRLYRRHCELCRIARQRMAGFDGWVSPTTPSLPVPVSDCDTVEKASAWNTFSIRNTRPGSLFGQCGVSIPIQMFGSPLPVGLQIMRSTNEDAALLSVAISIENAIGRAPGPDLSRFG